MGNSKKENTVVWGNIIKEWQESEELKTVFCKKRHLVYSRFLYWQRKLLGNRVDQSKPVFSEVTVRPTIGYLKLQLPTGACLMLPPERQTVSMVFELLGLK